ncbi:MAG: hypothetical protein K6U80_06895 [Firmicutes bacterium]|nr:hypothetical protein [Bacillota bacterium]
MPKSKSFFEGRKAVLLTKHGKEEAIKDLFEGETGCEIVVYSCFDTDSLGTFTRDIPRYGSQLETVRRKAMIGMDLTGIDIGLASEGSFGPHPVIPFLPGNVELIIFIDKREGIEIVGECVSERTNFAETIVGNIEEAEVFAHKAGFPSHFLIVNCEHGGAETMIKGVNTWEKLRREIELILKSGNKVSLETDMRAFANPTRMLAIKKAAEDLVQKIKSTCPKCSLPGFWVKEKKRGLPCECCGAPTHLVMSEVYICDGCSFTQETKIASRASAQFCDYCNP